MIVQTKIKELVLYAIFPSFIFLFYVNLFEGIFNNNFPHQDGTCSCKPGFSGDDCRFCFLFIFFSKTQQPFFFLPFCKFDSSQLNVLENGVDVVGTVASGEWEYYTFTVQAGSISDLIFFNLLRCRNFLLWGEGFLKNDSLISLSSRFSCHCLYERISHYWVYLAVRKSFSCQ